MFSKVLPTIGFILLAVIVSSILLSYYNVNMNDTSGLRVLNRQATYEGFKEDNHHQDEDDDEDDEDDDEAVLDGLIS